MMIMRVERRTERLASSPTRTPTGPHGPECRQRQGLERFPAHLAKLNHVIRIGARMMEVPKPARGGAKAGSLLHT
jgi:hypothetical protein